MRAVRLADLLAVVCFGDVANLVAQSQEKQWCQRKVVISCRRELFLETCVSALEYACRMEIRSSAIIPIISRRIYYSKMGVIQSVDRGTTHIASR